jgi:hypothetical protein
MGFETLPFPEGLTLNIPAAAYAADPRAIMMAEAARRLYTLREAWLNPPHLVSWPRALDMPVKSGAWRFRTEPRAGSATPISSVTSLDVRPWCDAWQDIASTDNSILRLEHEYAIIDIDKL